MTAAIERCPCCRGEGWIVPKTTASRAADQEWREAKGIAALFGAALGFTGALAFGGSWAMGFFVLILGFMGGATLAGIAERRERRGKRP